MGSSAPAPPPAPNPFYTAQAQTGENVATAIANASLSHVNQTDPYGDQINYSQTGSTPVSEAGITYNIPQYSQTTTLSPGQQQLFNLNQGTQQNIATIGNTQSGRIGDILNNPTNTPGVNLQQLGALPNADLTSGNINKFINTNWEQPFNDLWSRNQEQQNQQLADQGINLNDPAYRNAQYDFAQKEQGAQDTYANSMYGTAASNILAGSAQQDQNLINQNQINNNALLSGAGFNNANTIANRERPINEITALMGGSQIAQPSFGNVPQQNIPTTDYAGIVQNSYADQLASYGQQVQNQSANNAGLFGLGGTILGGLIKSDRRLKTAIRRIGALANGLNVYRFRYILGLDEHVGLMADEVRYVHPEAVVTGPEGYSMVNYEMAVR